MPRGELKLYVIQHATPALTLTLRASKVGRDRASPGAGPVPSIENTLDPISTSPLSLPSTFLVPSQLKALTVLSWVVPSRLKWRSTYCEESR